MPRLCPCSGFASETHLSAPERSRRGAATGTFRARTRSQRRPTPPPPSRRSAIEFSTFALVDPKSLVEALGLLIVRAKEDDVTLDRLAQTVIDREVGFARCAC